ncbi:ABC transporter-like protein [Glonium stellatum]|uniref:ABC transporter-like protein n=1 Tax=Glonium stellatum TaxID=574774 RepID=A0A8E2F3W6_9PEZI|nr:ABC transporter-like protein [Glonium stellatum]
MPPSCSKTLDNLFGPRVDPCRRTFDFTITFEEVLAISLSAVFLFLGTCRIIYLHSRRKKLQDFTILKIKLIISFLNSALQIALINFWLRASPVSTRSTIPSAILSLLDSFMLLVLSPIEHTKTIKPSALLSAYLTFSILWDAARTRSLWQSSEAQRIAGVFSASLAVRFILLILESWPKSEALNAGDRRLSPEETSSIFGKSVFAWLNQLIIRGYKRPLSMDDLYPMPKNLCAVRLSERFLRSWDITHGNHRLMITIMKTLKWPLIAPVLPRLTLVAFTVSQPLLIKRVIEFLDEPENSDTKDIGYSLIGAYVIVYSGLAFSTAWYYYHTWRFVTMIRGCLVSTIYKKTLSTESSAVNDSASVTLMSSDVERVAIAVRTVHEVWANFIQIGIAVFLMQQQLGLAFVAPVALAVCSSVAAIGVSATAGKRQAMWMKAIERRIADTSYFMGRNKNIKLLGLGHYISRNIQALRAKEIQSASHFRVITVCTNALGYAPLLFCPVVAFATFTGVAKESGRVLDTARMFTSYSLILLVASPLGTLLQSFPRLASAYHCTRRIQDYLIAESWHDKRLMISRGVPENLDKPAQTTQNDKIIVSIDDADIGLERGKAPILRNINFNIQSCKLTMVIGPVASGKSTLLKALLGEVECLKGVVRISSTSIGFCDQVPWLTNTTIREHITGVSDFAAGWYKKVVHACVLDEIWQFPNGDQSILGSDGVTLSGGQRHRVAIARAVYSASELIILDDILSGLDNKTQSELFSRLLGPTGLLRKNKITVVLATHAVQFIPYADYIIALSPGGTILKQGHFDDFRGTESYLHSMPLQSTSKVRLAVEETCAPVIVLESKQEQIALVNRENPDKRHSRNSLAWKYYFQSVGWRISTTFFLMEFLYALFSTFSQIWLKWWSHASNMRDRQYSIYPSVYALLQVLAMVTLVEVARYGLLKIVTSSGTRLHRILLNTTLAAPLPFLNSIDIGRTLNRFSQDMQLIDVELPVALVNVATCGFLFVGQITIVVIASYYIAVALPVIFGALYLLQKFYLRTSRQLRMLDLEARAPLFTHFTESLKGLATIRAFRWVHSHEQKNLRLLDVSQKPYYLLFCIQQWLVLSLDLMSAGFAVLLIGLVVALRDKTSPGFTGAALVNLMSINTLLAEVVNYWTQLETSMASVTRIRRFALDTPSENLPCEVFPPPTEWPQRGKIEICDVSASYGNNHARALDHISISILPGEKVGICGRSGSGKSSLVLTLFRMLDITAGSLTVDGIDLATIPRHIVRSRFNAIPQEPFLLRGSARTNMDPYGTSSDAAIAAALARVGLWDVVELGGGLDAEMREDMLSQGQRQLACLARALLRKSKLVVLDEVTSSVDIQTEQLLQTIIRDEFKGCTVIAVAHRLKTIMGFDRIVVLDQGRIVECDTPTTLLKRPSTFKTMFELSEAN